jgi:DNA-binding LacI/PurR family transcriptional regulator
MTRYVDGARARAAELGYTFDEIHCAGMGMGKRLQKVLFARGIRAVLIGSQHGDSPKPELDWTQLATVAQSYTVTGLNVSRALNNYFLSMRTAMAELMALGYRRIGYARTPHIEERTRYTNVSAYLGVQAEQARRDRVELLDWTKPDQSLLASWLKRERPEALITHDVRLSGILSEIGVRVPEDLGVALLSLHPGWEERFPEIEGLAGIDQRLELCGGVAVDLLVSRISQNELGLPAEPVLALTEGVWLPGGSVRQR